MIPVEQFPDFLFQFFKENGVAECLKLALEATARGIKFLNVDLYESEATVWKVKNETEIYPPFSAIAGLGETVAKKIVEERDKAIFISKEDLQNRGKINTTAIEKLRGLGVLKALPESSQLSLFQTIYNKLLIKHRLLYKW